MYGDVIDVAYCIWGQFQQFLSVAYVVYVQYARPLHVKLDTGMVIRRPNIVNT